MDCGAVGRKPHHRLEMVYQHLPAGFIYFNQDSRITEGQPQGTVATLMQTNTIMTDKEIKEYIENYIHERSAGSATASNLDEIRTLKELLDIGAITDEEFEAKKAQLLNL